MNKKWSKIEEKFIKEHCNKLTDIEIAFKLTEISNRPITMEAVRKKRQRLNCAKPPGRPKFSQTINNFHKLI